MLNSFKQAFKSLFANPARTGLTTLGIVIGIATVILVLSAGEGFKSYLNLQIEAFGTNTIFVQTKVPQTTRARNTGGGNTDSDRASTVAITTFKNLDLAEIRRAGNVKNVYGAVMGQKIVSYKQVAKNAFFMGAGPERFEIDKGKLARGRFFTDVDNKAVAQVAVLGHDIADDLFGQDEAVGKMVRVGESNFEVIGVYQRRGSFGFSNDDQQLFVPLLTAQKKLLGIDYIQFAVVEVENPKLAEATAEDLTLAMRRSHQITNPDKDDFLVQTQAQGLSTFNTILAGATFLLIAIAAISLLVGGVGIMNIMYVIVTERIAEIGLKKALGAKYKDILREFLLEAILLTFTGGFFGVVLGSLLAWAVSVVASSFGFAWKLIIPFSAVVLSFGVATGIGLVFGVFPARRAAKLDPMEALRQE
jgi:putative ABC transport system permease protein